MAFTGSSGGEDQGLVAHAPPGLLDGRDDKADLEEWVSDTGAASHLTDYLRCMRNIRQCNPNINGIGNKVCGANLEGILTAAFVADEDEVVVDSHDVMDVLNLRYNLFAQRSSLTSKPGIALVVQRA